MSTLETYFSKQEINRRAVIADLGATLAEEPAFIRDVEAVAGQMPTQLAHAIYVRAWIVEPETKDLAAAIGRRYRHGDRRSPIIGVLLRHGAAALQFMPRGVHDRGLWIGSSVMNIGSIAYTPGGQAAGRSRRPSQAQLNKRELGCVAIARRGADKCNVCGKRVGQAEVGGAVVKRSYRPLTCSSCTWANERRVKEAMEIVLQQCEWLLDEAMTLRVDLLGRG